MVSGIKYTHYGVAPSVEGDFGFVGHFFALHNITKLLVHSVYCFYFIFFLLYFKRLCICLLSSFRKMFTSLIVINQCHKKLHSVLISQTTDLNEREETARSSKEERHSCFLLTISSFKLKQLKIHTLRRSVAVTRDIVPCSEFVLECVGANNSCLF